MAQELSEGQKEARRVRAAFRQLHKYEHGKVILKYIEENYIFTTPYVKGSPDTTQVNVGKQWLALEIRNLADPDYREE